MKTIRFFLCFFVAVLAALPVLVCGGCADSAYAQAFHDPVPINDYVLVCMAHEYSFPEEDYPPEYFHAAYVGKVETLSAYHEGDLTDKDNFYRIEQLTLTEQGKENIDRLIAELNARDDIFIAGRDYYYYVGDDAPPAEPENGIPIDDYVTVCMTHEASFPETPHTPAYFNAKYVERVEPVLTYHKADFWDKDGFCLVERLYLTELGKECVEGFLPELNVRKDVLYAGRDYLYPNGDGPFGFVPGDADRDGAVTPEDARLTLRRAVKLDPCAQEDAVRCDMDGDEALTPADARAILRLSVHRNAAAQPA